MKSAFIEPPKRFSGVFLPELHAVEARRRRYRIEQLLGFLPKPSPPDPEALPPADEGAMDGAPTDEELEESKQQTEEARRRLALARGRPAPPPNPSPRAVQATSLAATGPAVGDGARAAAEMYLQAAAKWHAKAKQYRDAHVRAALAGPRQSSASGDGAGDEWERAETILWAAAADLSAAAKEVSNERHDRTEKGPAPNGGNASPQSDLRLSKAYGRVLACEEEVRKDLDSLHRAEPADRPAVDVRLCWSMFCLARAEQCLFETAGGVLGDEDRRVSCQQAAKAAAQEVQRTSRDWNRARIVHAEARRPSGQRASPPYDPEDTGAGRAPTRAPTRGAPGDPGQIDPPDPLLDESRQLALNKGLVGLALSGGGIRSGTFALGVLQGLAQLRLLGIVDYLSTVSGGGYVGSWFSAWVLREGSLANVERQLSPNRVSQAQATRAGLETGRPVDEEPEPVHHLRAYSRYLSPRFGPYSPDTWALFTAYLRNLFVNALFIVPLAVLLVFAYRTPLHGFDVALRASLPTEQGVETVSDEYALLRFSLTVVFLAAFVVGTIYLFLEEERLFEATLHFGPRPRKAERLRSTHWGILLMLLLMAATGSWIFSIEPLKAKVVAYEKADVLRYYGQPCIDWVLGGWPPALRFAACFAVAALGLSLGVRTVCWLRRRARLGKRGPWNWRGVVANLVQAACFGAALFLVLQVVWYLSYATAHETRPDLFCLLHLLGVPLIFGAMVLSGFAEMALVGRLLSEYEREWRSRLAAYLLMGAAAWLILGGATLYVPWLLEELFKYYFSDEYRRQNPNASRAVVGALWAVLGALWAAVSGGGAWAATRGAATDPTKPGAWWVRPLATVAPAVFLVGLLAGVSSLGQGLLERWNPFGEAPAASPSFLDRVAAYPWASAVLTVAALVLAVVFGGVLNVNRFSLHILYANRLTRCYLGASRRKRAGSLGAPTGVPRTEPLRQVNLFTGFDPLDDLPLVDLRTVGGTTPYTGPIPLINCAINCLAGDELAYQDRRADAFVLTPEKCGGRLTGYAEPPSEEPDASNLTLGRGMTISGAAVDPNMNGLSPALTALMTLFNTRLGWWVENPRPDRRPWGQKPDGLWRAREPGFGWPLLWEFLGLTNEDCEHVHLSDGGHFENLGVYELVRRRCRFIIVVDGGTDRTAASDNMAAMLRLVRTDFGIRIELEADQMQVKDSDGHSAWHCVIGRVRYDEVDEAAVPGVLVYLQATLTGDEPPDLLQYAARHPAFPRQSTLNQFFDEAQFECYRALGHHTALQVFGRAAGRWSGQAQNPSQHRTEVQAVFACLREQWFPPPPCSEAGWIASAQAALQLEQQLGGATALTEFNFAVYPELRVVGAPPRPAPAQEVQEFRAVSQTLQVMEIAWNAMNLEKFQAHPVNRGWMNTFRRWTSSAAFHRYWPFLRAEYSKPFVAFCENVLNLQPTRIDGERADDLPANDPEVRRWIDELDKQFSQEWADPIVRLGLPAAFAGSRFISDLAGQARPLNDPFKKPFLWLLQQGPTPGSPGRPYCCGIVCAGRSARQRLLEPGAAWIGQEAEFLVWLRGPYRTLGCGTAAVREILQEIETECAFAPPPNHLRRLTVYYPLRGAGPDGGLELERWMNFFFDQGFRRIRQPDTGLGAKFAILKRRLNR